MRFASQIRVLLLTVEIAVSVVLHNIDGVDKLVKCWDSSSVAEPTSKTPKPPEVPKITPTAVEVPKPPEVPTAIPAPDEVLPNPPTPTVTPEAVPTPKPFGMATPPESQAPTAPKKWWQFWKR